MAAPFRPHTVTVYEPTRDLNALKQRVVSDQTGGQSVRCLVSPLSTAAAFERWGIESSQPSELYANPGDGALFQINGLVTLGGKQYRVAAEPRVFESIAGADHAQVLLERL